MARGRAALERGGACTVLAEPLEKLRGLHDKWLFVQRARAHGLRVPETCRLTSAGELRAALAGASAVVLKPAYSRFAARTRLPPHGRETVAEVRPSEREPWVAQAYVHGRQICTYSIAHRGRLAAHVAYPVEFSAGQGAAVAFRPIAHPAAQAWVESFVAHESFTGQIAFDFIETKAGEVVALECNPRSTSGVHLLASHPDFARAFFGMLPELVTAETARPAMLAAGMLLYGLPAVRTRAGLRQRGAAFAGSRDVVFSARDPLPALLQIASLAPFLWWSARHHMSAMAASTYDIEWNGE